MNWWSRSALLLVLVGQTASAEVVEPPPEPTPAPSAVEPPLLPSRGPPPPAAASGGYSHKGQIMVSLRAALGMRAIVSYNKGDYCGATDSATSSGNAPVCTGRAPFAFDLELGYGVAQRIDAFVEVRLGLETDFGTSPAQNDGPRMLHISPGARFFFSDAKTSKLFTTAQLVFDFAGYKELGGASRGNDFGVRNMNGLWFDLDRAKGFYVYLGETATFSRWLRFELEAGVGFSARFR